MYGSLGLRGLSLGVVVASDEAGDSRDDRGECNGLDSFTDVGILQLVLL